MQFAMQLDNTEDSMLSIMACLSNTERLPMYCPSFVLEHLRHSKANLQWSWLAYFSKLRMGISLVLEADNLGKHSN